MIRALVKLINNYTEKTKKKYFYAYNQISQRLKKITLYFHTTKKFIQTCVSMLFDFNNQFIKALRFN